MSDWLAPAKLNLFLHVTGRREDGYHLLQTLFQFVDLCDTMRFDVSADSGITLRDDLPGVAMEDNLCVRAARRLQAYSGCRQGVRMRLEKRIPMGGGLGGGSSDAATTLLALNRLWGLHLERDILLEIALSLGADVPFFVGGQAAWAEGVGEVLCPVTLSEPWYLIVFPGCVSNTQAVFAQPELTRNCAPITIEDYLSGVGSNVCEPVARRLYPEVAECLAWLRRHVDARLSGTGSCAFAAFPGAAQAGELCAKLPPRWQGMVCRACNRSPVWQALDRSP